MITTTMRRLVPEEFISPLKVLGKYDWLRWTPGDTTPPSTHFELRLPNDPALPKCRLLIRFLMGLASEQSGDLFAVYVLSKALAEGPKLLCPTTEQCLALEHVDVNISFDNYVQPFPTFLLELPQDYRIYLTDRFKYDCPEVVTTHHAARKKYILSTRSTAGVPLTYHVMSPRWKTVEEALRFGEDDGNDLSQSEVIQRVALNFSLLMTHFGVRDRGTIDPASHATHTRNTRRQNPRKADRARRALD